MSGAFLRTCGIFGLTILLASRAEPVLAGDHFQAIQKAGVLRWGADAEGGAPYVYLDPQHPEQLTGFEFDLANALAAKLGVKAEMVQNQWDQLIPALQRGDFDIILNGLEITPQNEARVAMTEPYYVYSQQIVTRAGTTGLETLADLKGRRVGTLSASVAERIVSKLPGVDWRSYPGNVESFRDLKADRIDAVVLDLPIALYYAKPDPALKLSGAPFAQGYYGIGVLKQDQTLLAALNGAIGKLAADGTLERIYRKYGVWDERQKALENFKPVAAARGPGASWRERMALLPLLLRAAVVTVELSVLGMAVAVVAGLALAVARLHGPPPLNWLARAYVEIIRGTPLLLQLFLIYYGLPQIGVKLNAFLAGVAGLGLNYAASEAENYRAGIEAVPRGQTEAALALGMSQWQCLRRIIIPQAVRIVIPPVTNDFIAMFKDSSLVSVITMVELMKEYGRLATSVNDYIGLGLMTAGIYLALSYPASILATHLERRLAYDRR